MFERVATVTKHMTVKYLIATLAVVLVVLAVKAPARSLMASRSGAIPLPGDPIPSLGYPAMPEPMQRMTSALAVPLEAAVERLRPLTSRLFPSLWEKPESAAPAEPYSVRDTALRLVRESL